MLHDFLLLFVFLFFSLFARMTRIMSVFLLLGFYFDRGSRVSPCVALYWFVFSICGCEDCSTPSIFLWRTIHVSIRLYSENCSILLRLLYLFCHSNVVVLNNLAPVSVLPAPLNFVADILSPTRYTLRYLSSNPFPPPPPPDPPSSSPL